MQVINMTGKPVTIFTINGKGVSTLDILLPHGEDKVIRGYAPRNPTVLSLHTAEDDIPNNKLQVVSGKPTIWGNKERRIVVRYQGEERPQMG